MFEVFELNESKSAEDCAFRGACRRGFMLLTIINYNNICDAVSQEIVLLSTVTKHEQWSHHTMPIKECEIFIRGWSCGALCSKKDRADLQ